MAKDLVGGATRAFTAARRPAPPLAVASTRLPALSSAMINYGATASMEAGMNAMSATGTLFGIVDALATALRMVKWGVWRSSPSGLDEDRILVTGQPGNVHPMHDLMMRSSSMPLGDLIETCQQHYELVGEAWVLIKRLGGIPYELWPLSPERMMVVPSSDPYGLGIYGYVYTAPSGEQIPLTPDEVRYFHRPSRDPFRGIGAVQSVMVDVNIARYSAQWNTNFFLNSAEPGGIIEVPDHLSDEQFDELRDRWDSQHRGVARAHRVAILEQAKFVERKVTQRDMQFAEVRNLTRDIIREAYRISKSMLGVVEDVNRATAEAMDDVFGRWHVVPRLERWKDLFSSILDMFSSGPGYEVDYVSPLPEDRESNRNDLTARATAAKTLVEAGWDRAAVAAACGLPEMDEAPPAPPAPVPPAPADPPEGQAVIPSRAVLAVSEPGQDERDAQRHWQTQLDRLVSAWLDTILPDQYEQVVRQVREAVDSGDLAALAALVVSSGGAADLLFEYLGTMADQGAGEVIAEAKRQGLPKDDTDVEPTIPESWLKQHATATASLLAAGVALAAAGEALRLSGPGVSGDEVARGVRDHLDSLTDAQPRLRLGSALTSAQGVGRTVALSSLPAATYYASEVNDRNACKPCKTIDGKKWELLDDALVAYPSGAKYVKCEGRERCRGMVVAKWDV